MATTKDIVTELDETNDFGFSFHDEEEIVSASNITDTYDAELDSLKNRLRNVRKTYLPLLQHLAKDPDKPMIKWPNRKDILDKQIKKMIELTEV
jgi:hypothetical protein